MLNLTGFFSCPPLPRPALGCSTLASRIWVLLPWNNDATASNQCICPTRSYKSYVLCQVHRPAAARGRPMWFSASDPERTCSVCWPCHWSKCQCHKIGYRSMLPEVKATLLGKVHSDKTCLDSANIAFSKFHDDARKFKLPISFSGKWWKSLDAWLYRHWTVLSHSSQGVHRPGMIMMSHSWTVSNSWLPYISWADKMIHPGGSTCPDARILISRKRPSRQYNLMCTMRAINWTWSFWFSRILSLSMNQT